jgi:hypothetical protein
MQHGLPVKFVAALAVVVAAATLTSCSSGGPVEDQSSRLCPPTVIGFVNALNEIDSRLGFGFTISSYRELLSRARIARGRIVSRTVSADCARRVRGRAETALRNYMAAYTSWNTCLDWYTSVEVENELQFGAKIPTCEQGPGHGYESRQRHWARAHRQVRSAVDQLG